MKKNTVTTQAGLTDQETSGLQEGATPEASVASAASVGSDAARLQEDINRLKSVFQRREEEYRQQVLQLQRELEALKRLTIETDEDLKKQYEAQLKAREAENIEAQHRSALEELEKVKAAEQWKAYFVQEFGLPPQEFIGILTPEEAMERGFSLLKQRVSSPPTQSAQKPAPAAPPEEVLTEAPRSKPVRKLSEIAKQEFGGDIEAVFKAAEVGRIVLDDSVIIDI